MVAAPLLQIQHRFRNLLLRRLNPELTRAFRPIFFTPPKADCGNRRAFLRQRPKRV